VGNALFYFHEYPDDWATLRNDKSLVPLAIEEVLRLLSPLPFFRRQAVDDVDVNGVTIPKGAVVRAWIGAANRDPEEFSSPETFDIQRNPNRHIAFGFGSHACLGAPFARLQMRVVLSMLLDRFSSIRRADTSLLERSAPLAYGVKHLLIYSK
jgi:cytochrome P450